MALVEAGERQSRAVILCSIPSILNELREACASVAERARDVRINDAAIAAYAASLPSTPPLPGEHFSHGSREVVAAFWLTLDAINFGSGWFPTLRKRPGRSGYHTMAAGLSDRFADAGPWSADELQMMGVEEIALALGQDPAHELMELFARSLSDLGHHLKDEHGGSFEAVIDSARGSAEHLVEHLAGWDCFRDTSAYAELRLPFLKRAQIGAADLARSGVLRANDLERLTMFADNLVPHVLRLDGILAFAPDLVTRIDHEQLVEHGSPEEVEIRACALHAVELIVAQRPGATAAQTDQLLWLRGQEPRYKAVPRHRCRTTAY